MTEWWEEVVGSRLCHMCGASYKLYHDGGYHECGHPERDLMWKYKQHVPCKMAPVGQVLSVEPRISFPVGQAMTDIDKIEAWFRHGPPNMVCAHDVLAMLAELRAARSLIKEVIYARDYGHLYHNHAIISAIHAYDAAIGGEGVR